jgi:glycosyltransferase involved in cell wall biosynthesis
MASVAVIVPTRDRPAALARCLASLRRVRLPGDYELVVVDDGSRAEREVAALASEAGARLVRQESKGAAAARNAGWRASTAEVICFLDDDCEPTPMWASALSAAVRAGADVAFGPFVNGNPQNRLATASHTILDCLQEHTRSAPFFSSASFASTQAILTAVRFDERFPSVGGEDRDFALRVARARYRVEYVPQALVVHHADPTPVSFVAQHFRYGRGAARFQRLHGPRVQLEGLSFHLELARAAVRAGARTAVLIAVAEAAAAAGFLCETVVVATHASASE